MDDKSNDDTETQASAPVAKKPYVNRVLVRLGELQDVDADGRAARGTRWWRSQKAQNRPLDVRDSPHKRMLEHGISMRLRTGRPFFSAQRVPFHESSASRSVRRVGCLETAMAYAFLPRWMRAWWSAPSTIRQHPAVMSADCLIPLSRACTSPVDCRWPSSTGLPPLPYTAFQSASEPSRERRRGFEVQECGADGLGASPRREHHPVETHPEHDRGGYSTAELPMPGTAARARPDAPSIAPAAQVLRSGGAGRPRRAVPERREPGRSWTPPPMSPPPRLESDALRAGPLRSWLGRAILVVMALAGMMGFAALGVWQLERRAWKLDLIDRVERRIHAEPVPVPGPEAWPSVDAAGYAYRRVRLTGRSCTTGRPSCRP